ncbi:iron chelate uptake ABC transporter family permease subunit [Gracilibacillus salitolerans]|uniref:Iron chelate uptake ABC transporter family permease subunit n=1 Tax=Gracilibacillus salitolerans TaxID=2663022 RepID=A0A5Q2TLI1_9BACI|nr:iron ABC transporter permease [Gracilibacillus salitolerans]QGH35021.1 iron chelate uptake ABC transporter family permease subunit [Gracilibacillus salitolerans]
MKQILHSIYQNTIAVYILLCFLLLIVTIMSLSIGSSYIPVPEILKYLLGLADGEYEFTINVLRLPRLLLAFLVGAALSVSGLILQSIIRNPLASPDIIGITAGGSVGAMLFIVYIMGTISIHWLPLAAILGAMSIAIIVYGLAWNNGVTPIRLVLIGIGVSAAMNAVITLLIVVSETTVTTKAYLWLTGSLYGATEQDVYGLLPWVLIFIPLTFLLAKTIGVLELGDSLATSLGVNVQLIRFTLLFISVALAGSAVAFAGGIGFIGLIAPHIAKKLVGFTFHSLVPIAALVGGLMVMIADLIARTAFLPLDIPAGVLTAGIGAPFFIYLLYRNRHI